MASKPAPIIAGTLQTDPRSGGIKRSSGVNVLPVVAESKSLRLSLFHEESLEDISFCICRSSSLDPPYHKLKLGPKFAIMATKTLTGSFLVMTMVVRRTLQCSKRAAAVLPLVRPPYPTINRCLEDVVCRPDASPGFTMRPKIVPP